MTWQLLLIGFLALAPASYLFRRVLAQTLSQHNRLINGFFFIGLLYPTGLIVAFFSSPNLRIGWLNLLYLLVGSAVFPVVNLLAFRANKDVDAGLYTILNNLTPIVTITTATLLLNERLTDQQLLGAVIILCSAFLISLPQLRNRSTSKSTGVAFALASVILLGIGVTFERFMLNRMDFGAYLVFGWGAQTLWMAILAWPERKSIKVLRGPKFKQILGYGLCSALKGLCFVGALKLSGNASVVSAFSSFTAVLVVISAYIVLKEKDWIWFKIGSATLGTFGLIILNMH